MNQKQLLKAFKKQEQKTEEIKIYEDILEIFADGVLSPTDVVVIWGKRRKGKSSLAGMFMSEFMREKVAKNDIKLSQKICTKLNTAGFNIRPPSDHTVFCDTYFETHGSHGNSAYKFNAVDFGLPNDKHPTSLLCPVGRYFFDEIQDLFDSHEGALQTFVTKAVELGGQYKLFLSFVMQRPMRMPKDIRDLAVFIEVVGIQNEYNDWGVLIATYWQCNIIYDNSNLEQYLSTRNPELIDRKVFFKYRGNIFNCYDSDYFLPMFVRGKENESIVLEKTTRTEFSEEYFKEYYKNRVIDIPDTYRGKAKNKNKEKEKNGNGKENA